MWVINLTILCFKCLCWQFCFRPRKSSLSFPTEDDENVEEEADEVVPDGVEEVELARVNLEQKERMQKLIMDDIRKLSLCTDISGDQTPKKDDDQWMIIGGRSALVSETYGTCILECLN